MAVARREAMPGELGDGFLEFVEGAHLVVVGFSGGVVHGGVLGFASERAAHEFVVYAHAFEQVGEGSVVGEGGEPGHGSGSGVHEQFYAVVG